MRGDAQSPIHTFAQPMAIWALLLPIETSHGAISAHCAVLFTNGPLAAAPCAVHCGAAVKQKVLMLPE